METKARLYFAEADKNRLCFEIKAFVRSFMQLREVEKALIKEHTEPLNHFSIQDTLRKIKLAMSPSPSFNNSVFKRYSGGAKEKALEKISNGIISHGDKRVLDRIACSWCGGDLPKTSLEPGVQSQYCSYSCAQEGRLKRGGKVSYYELCEYVAVCK